MTVQFRITEEAWALTEPFEIAGQVIAVLPLLLLELTNADGFVGRGEAAGIDYDGETPRSMRVQLEGILPRLRAATTPDELQTWLPRGGARNALDCALWDLQAKRTGVAAWKAAGLEPMRPRLTACTIGLGSVVDTRRRARRLAAAPLIKVKVDGERHVEWLRIARRQLS